MIRTLGVQSGESEEQDKLDEYEEAYKKADPGYKSPNTVKKLALANHVRLVQQRQNHVQDVMDQIETDIQLEDGKEKLALYNRRFDQLKILLRPELQELYGEQQQYETNLAEQKKHEAEYKEQLSKYDNQLLSLQTKLYGLNWADDTFDNFEPGRSSTRVSHASGNVNTTGNHTRMATLKYKDCGEPHSNYFHGTTIPLSF